MGRILGDENVNINFTSVCRTAPKKQAVMAIGVDEKPDKETLNIGEVPAIEEFVFLGLYIVLRSSMAAIFKILIVAWYK